MAGLLFPGGGSSQNLIPNGNFENGRPPCEEPGPSYLDDLEGWYQVHRGPKYIRKECPDPLTQMQPQPFQGNGFLELTGSAWVSTV